MMVSDSAYPLDPAPGYSSRRFAVLRAGETMYCPNGHRFDDPLVWEFGGLRCKHKERNGGAACSALVFLVGGGLQSPAGEPLFLLIEVTAREMAHMKKEHMRWDQSLTYLGIGSIVART